LKLYSIYGCYVKFIGFACGTLMVFLLVLIPMQEDMSANSLFTYIIIIILFLFILLIVILSFLWLPPQHHGMWSTLHTITVVYFLMWFLDGSSCVCIYIYIYFMDSALMFMKSCPSYIHHRIMVLIEMWCWTIPTNLLFEYGNFPVVYKFLSPTDDHWH